MRRDFDIFEKFPDGSTLWRACVRGRFEAIRKIQEFSEHSENGFQAIDIQAGDFLPLTTRAQNRDSRPSSKAMTHG